MTVELTFCSGGQEKEGKYSEKENIFFLEEKKNREGKGEKYLEKISPKIVKDIEKSRFRSQTRDFCQFLEGFSISLGKFGLGKKFQFLFWKVWSQKSVSVSVKILVSSFSAVSKEED